MSVMIVAVVAFLLDALIGDPRLLLKSNQTAYAPRRSEVRTLSPRQN